jgi:hypothetical protein
VEQLLKENPVPEAFCAELAKLFKVRPTEVALLRLERDALRFVYPPELKTAGSVPLSSASSIAAHTALTKKVELYNGFVKVKHASIFETVKLKKSEEGHSNEQGPIQKLISGPVLTAEGKVLGVLQVSRKAFDLPSAGPDFTLDDLHQLEAITGVLAGAEFMQPVKK